MVPAPPQLPTRFPCWCRAVYSWGGESQRDLGFVEGDLIECLNAGDGSWWTGRLRRNKTVGVFPSNFVEVLPDSFRPVTRSTSPLIASNTPSPTNGTTKSKKPFRKPFEAYAKAPHYTTAKQPEVIRDMPERQASKISMQPSAHSSHGSIGRAPSPAPPVDRHGSWNSRAASPQPPISRHGSWDVRGVSPAPAHGRHGSWDVRGASPAPHVGRHGSWDVRATSPAPPSARHTSWDARDPSPQPPLRMSYHGARAASPQPPHPLQYNARAPSPLPFDNHYGARAPSPQPPMHYGSRAPSPQPSPLHYGSRAPSPAPSAYIPYRPGAELSKADSPPPPPPPPHRTALLSRGGSNASYDNRPRTPRAPSPCPPSPNGDGFTPLAPKRSNGRGHRIAICTWFEKRKKTRLPGTCF
ncbi:variant SH3 domain-containing protein [Apiospora arundinis]